jgi:hypothetical protein
MVRKDMGPGGKDQHVVESGGVLVARWRGGSLKWATDEGEEWRLL